MSVTMAERVRLQQLGRDDGGLDGLIRQATPLDEDDIVDEPDDVADEDVDDDEDEDDVDGEDSDATDDVLDDEDNAGDGDAPSRDD